MRQGARSKKAPVLSLLADADPFIKRDNHVQKGKHHSEKIHSWLHKIAMTNPKEDMILWHMQFIMKWKNMGSQITTLAEAKNIRLNRRFLLSHFDSWVVVVVGRALS